MRWLPLTLNFFFFSGGGSRGMVRALPHPTPLQNRQGGSGEGAAHITRLQVNEMLQRKKFSARPYQNDFAIPDWSWKVSKENKKKPSCCTYPPTISDWGLSWGSIERERNQAGCFSFRGKFRATFTTIGKPTFTWISRTKGSNLLFLWNVIGLLDCSSIDSPSTGKRNYSNGSILSNDVAHWAFTERFRIHTGTYCFGL